LDRVREVAAWLDARPQLGRDVFERGQPETWSGAVVTADYLALVEACLAVLQERQGRPLEQYRPPPPRTLWTPAHALIHMQARFLEEPLGCSFMRLLPGFPAGMPDREFHIRSAMASTLIATLELARAGQVTVEQDEIFGPINVAPMPA
jgi:segregation and condensation protein A